jgi:hypothetical protein
MAASLVVLTPAMTTTPTIESAWEHYADYMPAGSSAQKQAARRTFFAGATVMFRAVMAAVDADNGGSSRQNLIDLQAEIEQFGTDVLDGRA